MDVGRAKNLVVLALMYVLPLRFFVWAVHIAACQVGKGMKNRIVSPVMDPYEMRIRDVVNIHLVSLEKPSVDIGWLHEEARKSVGDDLFAQNQAAEMDQLLRFLSKCPETQEYFQNKN
jgi:hypothetical protein